MKLYDSIIKSTGEILAEKEGVRFPYDRSRVWKNLGESELIMRRDAAFELGGQGQPSVNYTCVTTSGLITEDEVYVYGPDLPDIRADVPFAKIVLLETNDLGESEDEEKAYRTIRNIEFVRYHVFPVGYMVRVSAQSNEEQSPMWGPHISKNTGRFRKSGTYGSSLSRTENWSKSSCPMRVKSTASRGR